MYKKLNVISICLVAFLLFSISSPMPLAYASDEVDYVPPPDVLPVVYLSGTPYEMGYQYGLQAGAYMEIVKNSLWSQLLAKYSYEEIKHHLEGFRYYISAQLNDIIIGIADGAQSAGYNITYDDALLMFCQAELAFAPPPETAKYGFGCTCISAFGDATKDGKAIGGANFDFFWNPFSYRVIVVAFPSTGNSFIASANAGHLANNFALNSKGLLLMNNRGCDKRPEDKAYGLPVWLLIPYLAMSASNAEEAKNLLLNTPLTMGVYHHFIDENGVAYAIETTAASVAVRKPGDFGEKNYLVTTNHWIIPEMKDSAWAWPPSPNLGSTWYRYETAVKYLETYYGELDVDKFKEILGSRDYWDGNVWHKDAGWTGNTINRYGLWGGTVTSHIGIPKDRTVYICAGNPGGDWGSGAPGLTGQFVKLKLGENPAVTTNEAGKAAMGCLKMANQALNKVKEIDKK
ncbi:MAG: hypothetical protein DRO52_06330, partial [Candidatus Hecatellales archaeon]